MEFGKRIPPTAAATTTTATSSSHVQSKGSGVTHHLFHYFPHGLCSVPSTLPTGPEPQTHYWPPAQTLLDKHTCCRSTGVSVDEMPDGLLASMLFLVSARGCSMLRLGRDVYRWLPCRLMVGATARSIGLRLRSRGSFRQSPLAVLFLKKRNQHSDGTAWHPANGEGDTNHMTSTSQGLFCLILHLAVDKYYIIMTSAF